MVGAIGLLVAELTPLLHVHTAGHAHGGADRHDRLQSLLCADPDRAAGGRCWPRAPGARAAASRCSPSAVLGLLALGITVFADLPDVHSTGLVGSAQTGLSTASSSAAIGLFLETGGGIALILTAAAGMLLEPIPSLPRAAPREPGAPHTTVRFLTTHKTQRFTNITRVRFADARVVPPQPPVPCGGQPSRFLSSGRRRRLSRAACLWDLVSVVRAQAFLVIGRTVGSQRTWLGARGYRPGSGNRPI